MHTFLWVWLGQLVSTIGSSMTGFALGIWMLQETGSATQFAIIFLSNSLPGIIIAPIAGAVVDRWDRRIVMMLSDAGAGLSTAVITLLFFTGRIEPWHIYVTSAFTSLFGAFQWPAYAAATTLLVPKKHYGRASGMVQMADAIGQIVAPVVAGILLVTVQIRGIILIDLATFLFAMVTLSFVRIPRPTASKDGATSKGSLLKEAAYGWNYIKARVGLFSMLILFAFINLSASMVLVLYTPFLLSMTTPEVLGGVISIGGIGMLLGTVIMSTWGGPTKRIYGIVLFMVLQGLCLLVAGVRANVRLFAGATFLYMMMTPIINGCSQAIWQSKVAPDVQGRVFAVRRMIAWSTQPIGYALAGPLADRVFEPLLAPTGLLSGTVGRIIGVGPGRGIAFMIMLLGGVAIVGACVALCYPRLRRLEEELPDVVPDQPLNEAQERVIA